MIATDNIIEDIDDILDKPQSARDKVTERVTRRQLESVIADLKRVLGRIEAIDQRNRARAVAEARCYHDNPVRSIPCSSSSEPSSAPAIRNIASVSPTMTAIFDHEMRRYFAKLADAIEAVGRYNFDVDRSRDVESDGVADYRIELKNVDDIGLCELHEAFQGTRLGRVMADRIESE